MTKEERWVTKMRKQLKQDFQQLRMDWNGQGGINQAAFCNCYDMIMRSLDIMEMVYDKLIWIAFEREYTNIYAMMRRLRDAGTKEDSGPEIV